MNLLSTPRKKSLTTFLLLAIFTGFAAATYPVRAAPGPHSPYIHIKILAINDFHGQLSSGRLAGHRPAGGAAVLASYLKAAEHGMEDRTVIVHAGDQVGASSPVSSLLKDEPSITFMNMLANKFCGHEKPQSMLLSDDPRCNIVGTAGNHEFDKGIKEMMRLITGGNHPDGPFLENPYRGAVFPYVLSNVVDSKTGKYILPPYVIRKVGGIRVAFIGAVLRDTPSIVAPSAVEGLVFLDEAESINKCIPELRAKGAKTVIAIIHQGGYQSGKPHAFYQGPTLPGKTVEGPIAEIVSRLDDNIDVIISGHTHTFINAFLKNRHGKDIVVTQAFSHGTAYADIDLTINRSTEKIARKSASVITTYDDAGPGLTPDPAVSKLVAEAEKKVGPKTKRKIGEAAIDITAVQNKLANPLLAI
jgi:5'-nucleotidase